MVTKEQAQNKTNLEKSRATLIKKARNKRENWIFFGWIFELECFIVGGFLIGLSCFFLRKAFFPLGLLFLAVGLYLSFDVGNKIERNAILNYQNDTKNL